MKKLIVMVAVMLLSACAKEQVPMKPVPTFPSVTELALMLHSGETTSVSIVTELLERADASSGLNAFITLDSAGALARARELDEMRAAGNIAGPLHGIPLVVKDNIHVAGLTNTAGTPGLADFTPAADSPTVAQLRAAGAIILGKTNLHELAFGITSDNGTYGAVGNPFDTATFAGGSSGGTAAAVSAGLAPAGLGTDTGGSARIPAALTGVVGFRPSTDRYDSSAVTPISHTRDTVGIIARSVADVSILDAVISPDDTAEVKMTTTSGVGATPEEARDAAQQSISATNSIRLGVARSYYFDNVDAETAAVIDDALEKLEAAGVTLVAADPGRVADLNTRSAFPIALFEVVTDLPEYLETFGTGQDFAAIAAAAASPDVQGLFGMLGTEEGQVPPAVYEAALEAREEMREMFNEYFTSHDLDGMIFPTTLLPARPIEGSLESVELNGEQVPTFPTYIHNTDPASIAALPGISLPAGVTAGGLPVGIEIDGPEGSDRHLLQVAAAVERILDYAAQPR